MQFAVARVLDVSELLWCHTPNGQLRDPVVAGRLVAAGVKRGVPDVLIFGPGGQRALELKRDHGGRLQPEQKTWLEELGRLGWQTGVVHGTLQALEQLEAWGLDVGGLLDRVEQALGYRLEGGRMVKRRA